MSWFHVDKNAIAANDRDGGQRPILIRQNPDGSQTPGNIFAGPGWTLTTQYATPQKDRPHAWLEVDDAL